MVQKWANRSQHSILVSALLSTVVVGAWWSIDICVDTLLSGHGVGALVCPHILVRARLSIHVLIGVLLSIHVLVGALLSTDALVRVLLSTHGLVGISLRIHALLGCYIVLVGTLVGTHVLSTRGHEALIKTLSSNQMLGRSMILNFRTTIMRILKLCPSPSKLHFVESDSRILCKNKISQMFVSVQSKQNFIIYFKNSNCEV